MKLPLSCAAIGILTCAGALASQDVATRLGDSLKVSATVDKRIYKAGETIIIPIHLAIPATRDLELSARAFCSTPLMFYGTVKKGSTDGTVSAQIDTLAVSAKCRIALLDIAPPPQVGNEQVVLTTEITLPSPIEFEIEGPPRVAEVVPGSVSAEAPLPERQFFRSRAAQLRDQRDALMLYLDHYAGESPELDLRLLDALAMARDSLKITRQDFIARYRPKGEVPVFFEDLDRRYEALAVDISAHRAKLTASQYHSARIIEVQELKQRPRGRDTEPDAKYPKLSGTLPPDANESVNLIEWNIGVYEKVSDSGEETFSISLVTLPPDASVEAKRIGEDYVMLGSKTTIPKVTFPYAIWTFRFTKENCREHVQRYDPIRDTSPSVSVELACSR
jgi:hypothetical protein